VRVKTGICPTAPCQCKLDVHQSEGRVQGHQRVSVGNGMPLTPGCRQPTGRRSATRRKTRTRDRVKEVPCRPDLLHRASRCTRSCVQPRHSCSRQDGQGLDRPSARLGCVWVHLLVTADGQSSPANGRAGFTLFAPAVTFIITAERGIAEATRGQVDGLMRSRIPDVGLANASAYGSHTHNARKRLHDAIVNQDIVFCFFNRIL
jgi:hypothetical protein